MLYFLIGILVLISLVLTWLVFGLKKKFENKDNGDKLTAVIERLAVLSEQNSELRRAMDNKLSETHQATQKQYGQSIRLISDVTEKLTKLDETNKQVINFSAQLQDLQDILKNPKQRGILGEYYLETLLKRVFTPKQYKMQYSLGRDETTGRELIVDAALFFGDKIIPIDSKFSLENYNRIIAEKNSSEREQLEKAFKQDLKNRIDETSKYIQPGKGTTDYAIMFIPAEGVYSDLLDGSVGAVKVNTRDLIEYAAHEKKVHIVSPTTFYVMIQSLFQGMRDYQIQESTKEIIKRIVQMGKHLRSYEDYLKKLGGHLSTTVNSYNNASKEFVKIDKDVAKITEGESKAELLILDKPNLE
jgi:DNA recombination protein RmuC